jgi:hypothetical protein
MTTVNYIWQYKAITLHMKVQALEHSKAVRFLDKVCNEENNH